MSYRVEKEYGQYLVIEKDTDHIVGRVKNENKAREICRSLNLGSGFNGYTPAFFIQDFKQKERPPTE